MKRTFLLITIFACFVLNGCGSKSPEAKAVIDGINSIGEVTYEKESMIGSVEEDYISLSIEQRKEVSNFSKLVSARKKMDDLIAQHPFPFSDAVFGMTKEELLSLIGQPIDEYDAEGFGHILEYDNQDYDGYIGIVKYSFEDDKLIRATFVLEQYSDEIFNHFNDMFSEKYGAPDFYASEHLKRWDRTSLSVGFISTDLMGGVTTIYFIDPEIELMSYSEAQQSVSAEIEQYENQIDEAIDKAFDESSDDHVEDAINDAEEKFLDEIGNDSAEIKTEKDDSTYEEKQADSNGFDIRNHYWGDSYEKVKRDETLELMSESENKLIYQAELNGQGIDLKYIFDSNGGLKQAIYALWIADEYRVEALGYYDSVFQELKNQFGQPIQSTREPQGEYKSGVLIYFDKWEVDNMVVELTIGYTEKKSGNNFMLSYEDASQR